MSAQQLKEMTMAVEALCQRLEQLERREEDKGEPPLNSLPQIQEAIGAWAYVNFKGGESHAVPGLVLGSLAPLLGVVEEVGELCGLTLQRHQARRGYDNREKYIADRNDAVSDILVFLCDYACREGIDLLTELNSTWNNVVSKRQAGKGPEHWDAITHHGAPEKFDPELLHPVEGEPPTCTDAINDAHEAYRQIVIRANENELEGVPQPLFRSGQRLSNREGMRHYCLKKPLCPECGAVVNDSMIKRYENGLINTMGCPHCRRCFTYVKGGDVAKSE